MIFTQHGNLHSQHRVVSATSVLAPKRVGSSAILQISQRAKDFLFAR